MMSSPQRLRIASRESRLALAQSEWVAQQLKVWYPNCQIEIIGMTTRGDQILDKPLAEIGGKGLFIKELEVAMAEKRADLAVHSMKDVPMILPPGFQLQIIGEREESADALVSSKYASLDALPQGARVGTSSLRRESQLRQRFPHLDILPLRGNVNTRLRKLDEGEFDAIILAAAGLKRLGLGERIRCLLSVDDFIPAIAQGVLGIEFCAERSDVAAWLAPFDNVTSNQLVKAERALGRALSANCNIPLGCHARLAGNQMQLQAFVGSRDGKTMIRDAVSGPVIDAEHLGQQLAQRLLDSGASAILANMHG